MQTIAEVITRGTVSSHTASTMLLRPAGTVTSHVLRAQADPVRAYLDRHGNPSFSFFSSFFLPSHLLSVFLFRLFVNCLNPTITLEEATWRITATRVHAFRFCGFLCLFFSFLFSPKKKEKR
jgi:hypothetical protein